MKLLAIITSLLTLGCVNAMPTENTLIHGVKHVKNSLSFLVTSTGCTTPDSFELIWLKNKVTINKIKKDHCRRMPHRIWLSFDLPKKNMPFKVMNSISS